MYRRKHGLVSVGTDIAATYIVSQLTDQPFEYSLMEHSQIKQSKNLPLFTVQGAVVGVILIIVMIFVLYKGTESYLEKGWAVLGRDVSFLIIAPLAFGALGLLLDVIVQRVLQFFKGNNAIPLKLFPSMRLISIRAIVLFLVLSTIVLFYFLIVPVRLRNFYLFFLFGPVFGLNILRFVFWVFLRKR